MSCVERFDNELGGGGGRGILVAGKCQACPKDTTRMAMAAFHCGISSHRPHISKQSGPQNPEPFLKNAT